MEEENLIPLDKKKMQEMSHKWSSEVQDLDSDDEGSNGNSEVSDSEDELEPGATNITA